MIGSVQEINQTRLIWEWGHYFLVSKRLRLIFALPLTAVAIAKAVRHRELERFVLKIRFCISVLNPQSAIQNPKSSDSVAQLVEQYTFNVWVLGSSPSGITEISDNALQANYLQSVFVSRYNIGKTLRLLFIENLHRFIQFRV